MKAKNWFSVCSLAGVAGCMVGPNYTPPVVKLNPAFTETQPPPTTQAASTVATIAAPPVEWWNTFRDTELQSLIERASKGNLNLQQAASRVRQARAQRGVTGADLLPDLSTNSGYQRAHGSKNVTIPAGAFGASGGGSKSTAASSKGHLALPADNLAAIPGTHTGGPQSPFGSGGFPGVNTDLYEVGFDSTWEIDVFGGTRGRWRRQSTTFSRHRKISAMCWFRCWRRPREITSNCAACRNSS